MSARTPLHFPNFEVTFPAERIIQVTLTRTEKLNCIDKATSTEISKIWDILDEDENLWVGIITGAGRAFCTGADLTGTQCHLVKSVNTRRELTHPDQNGTK
jgi:enoyl-CoA hydratase/carnithine racemase